MFDKIAEIYKNNVDATLVTVVNIINSVPTLLGSKMIVYANGKIEGTVGGGAIEHLLISDIIAKVYTVTTHKSYKLQDNPLHPEQLNMHCGGEIEVLIEPLQRKHYLYIVGAGHCAIALGNLAKQVNFYVNIIDEREEWVNKHSYADQLIISDYSNIRNKIFFSPYTYIVIMTHGHKHDQIVLEQCLTCEYKYLGVIGSKSKVMYMWNDLLLKGFNRSELEKIFSPIGFFIGSKSPLEVAISILSQLIAIKNDIYNIIFSSNPLLGK